MGLGRDSMHPRTRPHALLAIAMQAMQGNRTNGDIVSSGLRLAGMYRFAAQAYPEARWSQYSSAYDENQAFFYAAMLDDSTARGEPDLGMKLAWHVQMRREYSDADLLALPNYAHFLGEGDEHCVVPYNRFWWARGAWAGNVSIAEWLALQLAGTPNSTVDCGAGNTSRFCQIGLEMPR